MRYGDWRMVEKWRGGGTPIGGWLCRGSGKWRMFFILELGLCVEMTSEMEFLTFAHTLLHNEGGKGEISS